MGPIRRWMKDRRRALTHNRRETTPWVRRTQEGLLGAGSGPRSWGISQRLDDLVPQGRAPVDFRNYVARISRFLV